MQPSTFCFCCCCVVLFLRFQQNCQYCNFWQSCSVLFSLLFSPSPAFIERFIWSCFVKECQNFVVLPSLQFINYQHFLWVFSFPCKKVFDFEDSLSKFYHRTCTGTNLLSEMHIGCISFHIIWCRYKLIIVFNIVSNK